MYVFNIFLLSLKNEFLKWPDADERNMISSRFADKHGIPGAVGILDGTPVNFSQRPAIDGEVYFNRKSNYAYNVQLICDDHRVIRQAIIGWPGSVFDNTCWTNSQMYRRKEQFFNPGQFVIADAGYSLSSICCTPYRNPDSQVPINRFFNERFSSARVTIEHVNGVLKARWMSLRSLRSQVKSIKDLSFLNQWILTCIILYNMSIMLDDRWEEVREDEEIYAPLDIDLDVNQHDNLRHRVQSNLLVWASSRGHM